VMLNLGGIANVTFLPKGRDAGAVLGFDTGPGNMVLDGIVRVLTGGRESFDRGGARAAAGRVHASLLEELLKHPFFRLGGPKSTGRETFGGTYAARLVDKARKAGLSDEDLLATAAELTATTVAQAVVLSVANPSALGRVVVSGGGVHNDHLMERLAHLMKPVPVAPLETMGLSSDAKEAVAFAVLARETIHGRPSNLPAVTGARRPVVLGDITPGRRP